MRVAVPLVCLLLGMVGCGEAEGEEPEAQGVHCTSSAECTLDGVPGTCEPNGFCAYSDSSCHAGYRYAPGAASVENQCVDAGVGCGEQGETCCDGELCGGYLECSAGMCTCGDAAGAPCCGGTTCGDGLTCDARGTCRARL